MSKTKPTVCLTTEITAMCDDDILQYRLDTVQITPDVDDAEKVYAVATDSRGAAVVPQLGQTKQQCLVTQKMSCEPLNDNGKRSFPDVAGCLPSMPPKKTILLTLHPRLLENLQKALSGNVNDGSPLTLLLPPAKDGRVIDPIGIVGTKGVGVFMPCDVDANVECESEAKRSIFDRYQDIVDGFKRSNAAAKENKKDGE